MTISLVNTSSYASTGNATVHTCPIYPITTAGHKLIAVVAKAGVQSANTAGWTRIAAATDLDNLESDIFEKWSDGTETQFQVTIVSATACIDVYEWAGLQNAAADQATHNHSGATGTSAPTTGTTSATTQSVELVVVQFNYFSPTIDTFTVPPGFTLLGHRSSSNGAGSKTNMDVAYLVTSSTGTQGATATYSTSRSHRGANIATFLSATTAAPGQIYPLAKQGMLTHTPSIDVDSGTVKAAIGRVSDGFAFSPTDQFFSDVAADMVTTYSGATVISGISCTNGVVASSSPTIQFAIASGAALDFMVLFLDGGTAGTSPLLAYVPLLAQVLPVSGQVIQVAWDTGGQVLAGLFAL